MGRGGLSLKQQSGRQLGEAKGGKKDRKLKRWVRGWRQKIASGSRKFRGWVSRRRGTREEERKKIKISEKKKLEVDGD